MFFSPFMVSQDTLILKPPKKSPLLLRMAVLMFAMVCSVYICSICVKQLNTHTKARFLRVQIAECPELSIRLKKLPPEHYPKPKTFSRYLKLTLLLMRPKVYL